MYGVAYADKNGMAFSDSEPWLITQDNVQECKTIAMELSNEGYKEVIPFQFGSKILESYSWDYIKMNRIEI